ncbi:hypothetical protein QEN19_002501 [Hanseniaspora menglaensis]
MKLNIVADRLIKEKKTLIVENTISHDTLFNGNISSSVNISSIRDEGNDEVVDTLIIKDGDKEHTNKLTVIHLTRNGHILLNYINKNNESSTKVYRHIVDESSEFSKNSKILYHSKNLNCVFIKLIDSIVLLNLINFKRHNKIIEREINTTSKLHVIENDKYVVLSYSIHNHIKLFLWSSESGRYLKLNVIDLNKIKKYIKNDSFVDISYVSIKDESRLVILFERSVVTYDVITGLIISEKPSLSIKRIKEFPSDVINILDHVEKQDNISVRSSKHSKQVIKFISIIPRTEDFITIVDNYGNLYKFFFKDGNKHMFMMYDSLILPDSDHETISNIQYDNIISTTDEMTMFVYTDSDKFLHICYNNYSIVSLEVSSKLDTDYTIEHDDTGNKINVSQLNYKEILEINTLTIDPMNLINLINKVYFSSEAKMSDQEYLDMIRSSYCKLMLLKLSEAQTNKSILMFFNEAAIKYLLPLDIVLMFNIKCDEELFVAYLIEIKRYLTNISNGEASRYNVFFNNKIIINDYKFFIYNESLNGGNKISLSYLLKLIDEKLFENYLKKDLRLLELFIMSKGNKCHIEPDLIFTELKKLLNDPNYDIANTLKLIMKYSVFIKDDQKCFDIICNLNNYLPVEVPHTYINKILLLYLIESFPHIVHDGNVDNLNRFFEYLKKIDNYNNATTLSLILLQKTVIKFDGDNFSVLLQNIETISKFMVPIFLEFYSINNHSNIVIVTIINYYLNNFTNENIEKLHDILLSNLGKYDPFEVMIQINELEKKDIKTKLNFLQPCKILLWRQLKEDTTVLKFYFYKEQSLGMCFQYINSFKEDEDKCRFIENIQKLYEILTTKTDNDEIKYNYWLLFLQEYVNYIEVRDIPDFIKINDLKVILLEKLTKTLSVNSSLNEIMVSQQNIISIQEKYKVNKYINQFEEIT